jgi:hypothetical protein
MTQAMRSGNPYGKQMKKNHETQFLTNPILKDEIEKTIYAKNNNQKNKDQI